MMDARVKPAHDVEGGTFMSTGMRSNRLLKTSPASFRKPRSGYPESMPLVGLIGKCGDCGFRAPAFGRPRNDQEEFLSNLLMRRPQRREHVLDRHPFAVVGIHEAGVDAAIGADNEGR